MFFFSDEVKAMGNETYKKNDLYLALDYYEHVSVFFGLSQYAIVFDLIHLD